MNKYLVTLIEEGKGWEKKVYSFLMFEENEEVAKKRAVKIFRDNKGSSAKLQSIFCTAMSDLECSRLICQTIVNPSNETLNKFYGKENSIMSIGLDERYLMES